MAHELRQVYASIVDAKIRKTLVSDFAFNTKYEGLATAGKLVD